MAIIMGKGCMEAIYGLMGWKGLKKLRQSSLNSFRNALQCSSDFSVQFLYRQLISKPDIHVKKFKKLLFAGFFLGTRLAAFPHRFSNCRINLTLEGPFPHLF